jgi:uncharacterized OB-fold protein
MNFIARIYNWIYNQCTECQSRYIGPAARCPDCNEHPDNMV